MLQHDRRIDHGATESQERKTHRAPGKRTLTAGLSPPAAAAPSPDKVEAAEAVLETVSEMIDNRDVRTVDVGDDGMARPHDFTKDVAAEYVPLIKEWQFILAGRHDIAGGPTVIIEGDMVLEHIDGALATMRPVFRVLEGDERGLALTARFKTKVAKLRATHARNGIEEAVRRTAGRSIDDSGAGFDAKTEDEQIRQAIAESLQLARRASTVVQRFAGDDVRRLDQTFKTAAKDLAPIAQIKDFDRQLRSAQTTSAALQHVAGYLTLISAVFAVADPEERASLWNEHAGTLGKVRSVAQIAQTATQLVSGSVAVVGTVSYAAAKVNGDADLARKALNASGRALGNIGFVLNVIGLIRGVVTLLDPDATNDEKAQAVVDTAASGLGIAARLMPTFTAAGPAAFALVVTFYTMNATIKKGLEAYAGLISAGLQECFDDMRSEGRNINQLALELAITMEWHEAEPDAGRRLAIADVIERRTIALSSALNAYLQRASRPGANRDPGTWGPIQQRFTVVARRTSKTSEETLKHAAQVIEVFVHCLTRADVLFVECAEWAMEQYG